MVRVLGCLQGLEKKRIAVNSRVGGNLRRGMEGEEGLTYISQ